MGVGLAAVLVIGSVLSRAGRAFYLDWRLPSRSSPDLPSAPELACQVAKAVAARNCQGEVGGCGDRAGCRVDGRWGPYELFLDLAANCEQECLRHATIDPTLLRRGDGDVVTACHGESGIEARGDVVGAGRPER